jgi:hypothetical protein
MILPESLKFFMARVMLTLWAPTRKLSSSWIRGKGIDVSFRLLTPCSRATAVSEKRLKSAVYVKLSIEMPDDTIRQIAIKYWNIEDASRDT